MLNFIYNWKNLGSSSLVYFYISSYLDQSNWMSPYKVLLKSVIYIYGTVYLVLLVSSNHGYVCIYMYIYCLVLGFLGSIRIKFFFFLSLHIKTPCKRKGFFPGRRSLCCLIYVVIFVRGSQSFVFLTLVYYPSYRVWMLFGWCHWQCKEGSTSALCVS
jgi:hypothetical protein